MYAAAFYIAAFWAADELYIWVIYIEIQRVTFQAGKSANDLIFKMQQLHDPFMPLTASTFSLKREKKTKRNQTQISATSALCFAFYPCHRDDVENQQGFTVDSY